MNRQDSLRREFVLPVLGALLAAASSISATASDADTQRQPTSYTSTEDLCKPAECEEAFKRFKRINKISPLAQYALAMMHVKGLGTEQSLKDGFYWMQRAARSDLPYAQYSLAKMFQHGIGVDTNQKKSDYWMKRALASGFDLTPLIRNATQAEIDWNRAANKEAEAKQSNGDDSTSNTEYVVVETGEPKIVKPDTAPPASDELISVVGERVTLGSLARYAEIMADKRPASESLGSRIAGRKCNDFSNCGRVDADTSTGAMILNQMFMTIGEGSRPAGSRANCDKRCRAEKVLFGS